MITSKDVLKVELKAIKNLIQGKKYDPKAPEGERLKDYRYTIEELLKGILQAFSVVFKLCLSLRRNQEKIMEKLEIPKDESRKNREDN